MTTFTDFANEPNLRLLLLSPTRQLGDIYNFSTKLGTFMILFNESLLDTFIAYSNEPIWRPLGAKIGDLHHFIQRVSFGDFYCFLQRAKLGTGGWYVRFDCISS